MNCNFRTSGCNFHQTNYIKNIFHSIHSYVSDTNQMYNFQLVHTLNKFLLHVSVLTYHLQGEQYGSFLKKKRFERKK
jgi:hypothetical protein